MRVRNNRLAGARAAVANAPQPRSPISCNMIPPCKQNSVKEKKVREFVLLFQHVFSELCLSFLQLGLVSQLVLALVSVLFSLVVVLDDALEAGERNADLREE